MQASILSRRLIFLGLALALIPALITAADAAPQHGSVGFVEVKYGSISTY